MVRYLVFVKFVKNPILFEYMNRFIEQKSPHHFNAWLKCVIVSMFEYLGVIRDVIKRFGGIEGMYSNTENIRLGIIAILWWSVTLNALVHVRGNDDISIGQVGIRTEYVFEIQRYASRNECQETGNLIVLLHYQLDQ